VNPAAATSATGEPFAARCPRCGANLFSALRLSEMAGSALRELARRPFAPPSSVGSFIAAIESDMQCRAGLCDARGSRS
jgi:hypothetical protein